jgi:myo-inositol 2-dehydrogenase/D-chiro-inositol 1-dehydrogenase
LDWELWLGPTPKVDFAVDRRRDFRWWFEYSGGKMTDWGAHHIDIAQWALGFDKTGPVKVSGTGKFPPIVPEKFDWDSYLDGKITLPNAYNTATQFSIDLEFANGAVINVNHDFRRESDNTQFDNGILFEGEEGRIFVNRGRISGVPIEQLTAADKEEMGKKITKLYKGKIPGDHMRNFFECVQDRSEPISDVVTHVRTMESCHLCNIALMLGRKLQWDPDKEQFIGDDQANALMARVRREPYKLGV